MLDSRVKVVKESSLKMLMDVLETDPTTAVMTIFDSVMFLMVVTA